MADNQAEGKTAKVIRVGYVARVEGETAFRITIEGARVHELELKIFEPPRFFEGFLVGRRAREVGDIVARICGICPVSHGFTALRAIEKAVGIRVSDQTRRLREIMALSQIAGSHLVHLYFLALPDYLGMQGVPDLVGALGEKLSRLYRLKDAVNDVTTAIGGRALHPVTAVVGGFTDAPSRRLLADLARRLRALLPEAVETVRMLAGLDFPEFDSPREYVGIVHPDRYAINEGRLTSTRGLDVAEADYPSVIEEEEVPYAMAKRARIRGKGALMVGALARLHLKSDKLSPLARGIAGEVGLRLPDPNPFHNNLAQAVEIVHCMETCAEALEGMDPKPERPVPPARGGFGGALTEAPRGLLYHAYEVDRRGIVRAADIVTPTAHNFKSLEEHMTELATGLAEEPSDRIRLACEMLIRAYDPCFSCSVH
jgi:coenzyme F420-reducing hydrogenase alpha subunit